ncbi:hypothetical protein DU508_22340 [Pedobacter chinensis]|uniref:Uncharacterized protein n=1 Tax=Pedobacter chinensis TaxID=2282421 RepID=A0A369PNQ0_9SPHI|nr:hypothetical protein [Pedobacter chinensis]RDC54231.1 hypothetical protein DU508_22340 [Pedobacter chinensis]
MPEDYKKVVLSYYEERINDGSLSPNLLDPTPGSLREECIYSYRKRHSSKDDEIIRSFFGDTEQECLDLLEKSFAIKFRQLPKILKGKVENPSIKYIELIAWLIDFQPRPSTSYYKSFYSQPEAEAEQPPITETGTDINKKRDDDANQEEVGDKEKIEADIPGQSHTQDVLTETGGQSASKEIQTLLTGTEPGSAITANAGNNEIAPVQTSKNKLPIVIIICIIVLLAGRGAFYLWEESIAKIRLPLANEHCMYWTGSHYEPTKCNVLMDNVSIIPLNLQTLKRLKKIRHPEKLTKSDLGKVWYAKIEGKPEFFTDSGMHPVDTLKRLRPLTPYILDKNITRTVFLSSVLGWLYYLTLFLLFSMLVVIYFRRSKNQSHQA